MAEVSLPNEMQYFPPSVAARARSYRQTVTPVNPPPYKPTERIRIALGTTPGTYLNTQHSFLQFNIRNLAPNATNDFRIDKHGSAFIDRIEVYHAGALLDTVMTANVLYSVLMDATVSMVDMVTTHVAGGVEDYLAGQANLDLMYQPQGRTVADGNGEIRVAFPLIGLLSPAGLARYVPLGDAVNGNIEIDIYLAQQGQPVVQAGAGALAWEITDVNYMAQLVEIDSAVHQALIQSIGGIYTLPYNSWRTYSVQIPAQTTSYTHYIPTKVSSLSGVVVCLRPSADITDKTKRSISGRTRSDLRSAQLRIGALNFPLRPVQCDANQLDEAMLESFKMFGRLGTSMGGTSISRTLYSNEKFFLAFDTQAYSAASMAVDDGVQAQHGSTYLQLEFGGGTPALQMDIFILFDGMLTVANGAISAAF